MNTDALISLVRAWGVERNIIGPNGKATQVTQLLKLVEEVDELDCGISDGNKDEIIDAIGDCTVVLILLAETAGLRFEDCLQSAYDEIKGRTGQIINGQFVKD